MPNRNDIIQYTDFTQIKAAVDAALKKRNMTNKIRPFSQEPSSGEPIKAEHLNLSCEELRTVNTTLLEGMIAEPGKTYIDANSLNVITDTVAKVNNDQIHCSAGCQGTCHSTCLAHCADNCTGTCKGSCSGCSGGCQDHCAYHCSGGCSGSCTGSCVWDNCLLANCLGTCLSGLVQRYPGR